jgi:hypothetical protein
MKPWHLMNASVSREFINDIKLGLVIRKRLCNKSGSQFVRLVLRSTRYDTTVSLDQKSYSQQIHSLVDVGRHCIITATILSDARCAEKGGGKAWN